jgi:hypothetical protein
MQNPEVPTRQFTQPEMDAFSTSRALHDAELIRGGAQFKGGVLEPTAVQLELIEQEAIPSQAITSLNQEATQASSVPPEAAALSPKAVEVNNRGVIHEWLAEGLVLAHTWLKPQRIDRQHNIDGRVGGFSTVYSDTRRARRVASGLNSRTPDSIMRAFSDQNIPELVTLTPIKGKQFGAVDPASAKSAEAAYMILYETLPTRKYQSTSGVKGNFLKVGVVLPESKAREAVEQITANPLLIRDAAEVLMQENIGLGGNWENSRPHYDAMMQINGGTNRMAIREGNITLPDKSSVLEF